MSRTTPRKLKRDLDELKRKHGEPDGSADVTVDWRVPADPDPADNTIHYDPETKTLTYDIWSAQHDCLEALQDGTDIAAFLGGYASGKSVIGGRWVISLALTYPGSQFLAMGTSFSEARHTTFPKLFAQLPGDRTRMDPERSPLVAEYVESKRLLMFTNGSVIVLGSADTSKRYAGAEFGGIWLDEPSHYEADLHDLLEMLDFRLRGVPGPKVQCWTLTGNGYNDAWEILEQRQDSTGDPLGHTIKLIRASTLENPYLEADVRKDRNRQYGGTDRAEQALHGGFATAKGLVYSQFSRSTHVIPHAEAVEQVDDTDDWRVYGYDAGWNDPRIVLELGKTPYDQLIVLDVFYESESHVEDAIRWLGANEKPQGTIYCEHVPEDIERFNSAGYPAENATKSIDPGIDEVRKRLEADGNRPVRTRPQRQHKVVRRSGRDSPGRRKIVASPESWTTPDATAGRDGRVGLLVSKRCDPLIREFLSYKEDHVGETVADDDCLDALRYACLGVAGR